MLKNNAETKNKIKNKIMDALVDVYMQNVTWRLEESRDLINNTVSFSFVQNDVDENVLKNAMKEMYEKITKDLIYIVGNCDEK